MDGVEADEGVGAGEDDEGTHADEGGGVGGDDVDLDAHVGVAVHHDVGVELLPVVDVDAKAAPGPCSSSPHPLIPSSPADKGDWAVGPGMVWLEYFSLRTTKHLPTPLRTSS